MQAPRASQLHGILLMALFSFSAFYIAEFPIIRHLSLSPLIIGILLGMMYANTLRMHLPEAWTPGITFCSKRLLRAAIVCYGFRLTFQNIAQVGLPGIVIDVIMVCSIIGIGLLVGRWLRMDSNLTILTASGSAICGAAAVLGTESVLPHSKPHQTAVAVSTVVIFGTLSMFLYPTLYRMGILDLSPEAMGIYTGSTLHEVAHVVGASDAMNDATITATAIIVKMTRVILLVPFLLILSYWMNRRSVTGGETAGKTQITVPWFAFGFLAVIAFNSFHLLPQSLVGGINTGVDFALTMAMTALGAESSFEKFKQAGAKPFILALVLFLVLVLLGYTLSKFLLPIL